MRVDYLSPLPPEASGVADYSALLLPALRRQLEVEVVPKGRRPRRRTHAELGIFHIGNSPEAHGWIFEELRARPGLVVLHEFAVHHLVAGMTVGRGDGPGYLDAMQREAGVVGRLLAHGVIDGLVPPLWERRAADFPLAREVLGHARGVIVHSQHVEEHVRDAGYGGPVFRIPHPAWTVPEVEPYRPVGGPVVAMVGHINPEKRIGIVLDAFAALRATHPEARLVVAGAAAGVELERLVADAGLGHATDVLGRVDELMLWSVLRGADACVSLRFPTMGETSGVAVRALSAGTPLVVSDVGWFAELPDTVALKVPVGAGETETLTAGLRALADDGELRRSLGAAGRELAATEHDVDRVAEAYSVAAEDVVGLRTVEDALLRHVAVAAADTGVDQPTVRAVAAAAREVTRGE
ncbi:MAG: glycosyltransferase family 4 protein [Gaiellaceae bacterium]